jgi:hypothetical protein
MILSRFPWHPCKFTLDFIILFGLWNFFFLLFLDRQIDRDTAYTAFRKGTM